MTPIPSPFEVAAANFAANLLQQVATEALTNPQGLLDAFDELFDHHHTGYDACQDILDAVEAGHLSHGAALQAIAILMADMERRQQRPAAPPPAARSQRSQATALGDRNQPTIDLAALLRQFA